MPLHWPLAGRRSIRSPQQTKRSGTTKIDDTAFANQRSDADQTFERPLTNQKAFLINTIKMSIITGEPDALCFVDCRRLHCTGRFKSPFELTVPVNRKKPMAEPKVNDVISAYRWSGITQETLRVITPF